MALEASPRHASLLSRWEFENGSKDGWGSEASLASGMELDSFGGELRGTFVSASPGLNSPLFRVNATDRTTLVFRMSYLGAGKKGGLLVRARESSPAPALYGSGNAPWPSAEALSSDSVERDDGTNVVSMATTAIDTTLQVPTPPSDEVVWRQEFDVVGDGIARTYYVPLYPQREPLRTGRDTVVQFRLEVASGDGVGAGQSVQLDFIRLMEAPALNSVSGCSKVVGSSPVLPEMQGWEVWVREEGDWVGDQWFASYEDTTRLRGIGEGNDSLPFGITYDCALQGGEEIVLRGSHFGTHGARVFVDDTPCVEVQHGAGEDVESMVSCRIPSGSGEARQVRIEHGELPGLFDSKPFLSYAVGPAPPENATIVNLGAMHTGIQWDPPADWRDALTVTGFVVEARAALNPLDLYTRFGETVEGGVEVGRRWIDDESENATMPDGVWLELGPENEPWFAVWSSVPSLAPSGAGGTHRAPYVRPLNSSVALARSWASALDAAPYANATVLGEYESLWGPWGVVVVVGNVSGTTITGLRPGTPYQFRVAALSEDTVNAGAKDAWRSLDAYGRRPPLPSNQREQGDWRQLAGVYVTLEHDIEFAYFDANATIAHGAAYRDMAEAVGPLGERGGEGSHGIVLVGSASVAGCNQTHSCCDGYRWSRDSGRASQEADAHARRNDPAHEDGAIRATPMLGIDPSSQSPVFGYRRGWWEMEIPRPYPAGSGAADAVEYGKSLADPTNFTLSEPTLPSVPIPPWNESAGAPWRGCRASCVAVARIRPPYLNHHALRGIVPEPAPRPATSSLSSTPTSNTGLPIPSTTTFPLGSRASSASDDPDTPGGLPAPPTRYPSGLAVGPLAMLNRPPMGACGPALRLTASHPAQTGAAWYARPQQVREGFVTEFVIRLSSPSFFCRSMDDAHTNCHSRGGDGIAFVIQNHHPSAMGRGGKGMGFEGVRNSVAVELDTWFNSEKRDLWDNHVAVLSRGARRANSANHSFALGESTTHVPDLTDGLHRVRIVYDPHFDRRIVSFPTFAASAPATSRWLPQSHPPSEYLAHTPANWVRDGFGSLAVFFDGSDLPALIVPINLAATIDLSSSHGRAWVGFTAATGNDVYQTHDILDWTFTQLRRRLPHE